MNPDVAALHAFLAEGTPRPVRGPLLDALGSRLTGWDGTTLTLTFAPGDLFRQGAGVVQGGAVAAMLDFALAFAAMTALPAEKMPVTASLTTSFFAAARTAPFRATAQVTHRGGRAVFATATLWEAERRLAEASATMLVVDNR